MTVTYIGPTTRSASNRLGVRSYTHGFLLSTDAKADTEYDVGSHGDLPVIGDVHADDTQAYCTELSVDNHEPWQGWTATAQYSTERKISKTDPADDEIKVSWTTEIYQEPVFSDVNGNAVVNSAGDYYIDPTPSRDTTHLIAKISSNHQSIPEWVLGMQNNVNDSQVTIGGLVIAAGLARMSRLEISERQRRNDIDFYSMSFEIHLHKAGWLLEPMDVGFRELEYVGDLVQIKDSNGDEVTTPVMLDGAGRAQDNPTPSSAVFGSYQIYETSDLSALPGID